MYIQSTQGLAVQGSGSGELNYGVRHISKSMSFTYASGTNTIFTITASGSAPTNFTMSLFITVTGEASGNTNGPGVLYYIEGYYLNSSGIWTDGGGTAMIGSGQAWQNWNKDISVARVYKWTAAGNNASFTTLYTTVDVMISCSDFSLLTFS